VLTSPSPVGNSSDRSHPEPPIAWRPDVLGVLALVWDGRPTHYYATAPAPPDDRWDLWDGRPAPEEPGASAGDYQAIALRLCRPQRVTCTFRASCTVTG
jgi:hypothetical protein